MKFKGKNLTIKYGNKEVEPPIKRIGNVLILDEKNIPINEKYQIVVDGKTVKNENARKLKKPKKFSDPIELTYYKTKQLRELKNNRHGLDEYIVYTMHIRGFTKSKTSSAKNKGTFEAAKNNISYLKNLGFNAVELLPIYYTNPVIADNKNIINYWGYTVDAQYYAVNPSYGVDDEINEFREFVKECHQNDIDVILQFYFDDKNINEIEEILGYWIYNFGVDGFHLLGNFDKKIIGSPYLADSNLFIDQGNETDLTVSYNDEFMVNIRKIMQGDKNAVRHAVRHIITNQKRVNYVANVDGFTLRDVFSYVNKHNESNGEFNKDGREFNFSQNQGFEGETEDEYINRIRKKLVKNALTFLFMSSGIPLINMGDECYKTHLGNNNMYCSDSELNYLTQDKDNDIAATVKSLIDIRKYLNIDYNINRNYSLHGHEAWINPLENYNGCLGIYQSENIEFFIAVNFTEEEKILGVPNEADNLELIFTTSDKKTEIINRHVTVYERSISIFAGKDKLCVENM